MAETRPIIGVLAFQGDFRAHARASERSGAMVRLVHLHRRALGPARSWRPRRIPARNGYGRQLDSFEATVHVEGLDEDFPGIFIPAPVVEEAGVAAVFAEQGGRPVGARQGEIIAVCFHPEPTGDLRIHREFVRSAEQARSSSLR